MNEKETFVEAPAEEEYYEDDDFGVGDYVFIGFIAILICAVFAFAMRTISKHLKNVKFKVGAVEVGVETKAEDKKD